MTLGVFQKDGAPGDLADLTGVTILFVEDFQELRTAMAIQLRECGATVLEAASPGEALELAMSSAKFQILLTDQDLEDELSGTDLALHLCHRRPDLRVMLLSGRVDNVLLGRMRADWRVLSKPVGRMELAAAIGGLVAH